LLEPIFGKEHLRAEFAEFGPALSTKPHLLECVMNALLWVASGAKPGNGAHNVRWGRLGFELVNQAKSLGLKELL